jgi:TonB family protein
MRIAAFILLLLIHGQLVSGFAQESSVAPQQLIELSRKASDLTEIGPYRLQANVALFFLGPKTSKEVKGQITVFRDKDRYRSELQMGDSHESRWIKANMLYIARSRSTPVPRATFLKQLDRLWRPSLAPGDGNISRTFKHKQHGKELECIEVKRQDSSSQKLCFDPSTSALVTASGFEHNVEFQDFDTIDQKLFPKRIVFRADEGVVLEVRDITIVKASFAPDVFIPPDGTLGFPTCDEPTPARRIKYTQPTIPKDALQVVRSAEVHLYGIIGTAGSIQNVSVEYSPHAAFTASAVEAVRQWQYAPALCSDKPVPMETEVSMRYTSSTSVMRF